MALPVSSESLIVRYPRDQGDQGDSKERAQAKEPSMPRLKSKEANTDSKKDLKALADDKECL